jgi:hypothetical protein
MGWVYVPESSHSLLEPGLASTGQRCSVMNSCAPSSGSRTASAYSRPGCVMACSTTRRSGITCGPSTGTHGGGASMCFPQAFRARPSRSPERCWQETTPETCGLTPHASLESASLQSSGWRTFQVSLLGAMGISDAYSVTWPRWGMMLSGASYLLPRPELPTRESVSGCSGSIPTPTAGDSKGSRNMTARRKPGGHAHTGMTLVDYVTIYPTPSATSYGSNKSKSDGAKMRLSLESMASPGHWPTPTAQDAKNSTLPPSQVTRDSVPGAQQSAGHTGKLAPGFVEWLMGVPTGWTGLEPLEMDKCPNKSCSRGTGVGDRQESEV